MSRAKMARVGISVTVMTARRGNAVPRSALRGSFALCALAALALFAVAAGAQEAPRPSIDNPQAAQPAAQPVPAQPAPPRKEPGFFDAMGRWFDQSAADFKSGMNKMKNSVDEFNDRAGKAAKDAAAAAKGATDAMTDAMVKLPGTRVVDGRERCELAANGSPDCRAAAEAVCKGKGFGSGKSLDTQASQKCPARIWLSGRLPQEGECQVETFVTRAVCQ